MPKLFLAHGVLGYGGSWKNNFDVLSRYKYFSDIKNSINANVLTVYEPSVNPVGLISERAGQLVSDICEICKGSNDEVYILAHSMGGLDAIAAIPTLINNGINIKALATIGTPYLGSEVADEIYNLVTGTTINNILLFQAIPSFLISTLRALPPPALNELRTTTRRPLVAATLRNPALAATDIYVVASDITQASNNLLFNLAGAIAGIAGPNDGVVSVASANPDIWIGQLHRHVLPIWPVDHMTEVGWIPSFFSINSQHITRYITLISQMTGISPAALGA